MKKLVLALLVLCVAGVANAWPPPPLPQCDFVSCADGCTVPASSKCALVASDAVNNAEQVTCVVGSNIGTCIP